MRPNKKTWNNKRDVGFFEMLNSITEAF